MGASYVNITFKGPSHWQIADCLHAAHRRAYVAPCEDDITVVYDSELTAGSDRHTAMTLAESVTNALDCVALVASVYDSDLFEYALYRSGDELDRYNSRPDYGRWGDRLPPAGGDAARLCEAFGIPVPKPLIPGCQAVIVDRILRKCDVAWGDSEGKVFVRGYVFEDDRHRDLLKALGISAYIANSGYEMFEYGSFPKGFPEAGVLRVGRSWRWYDVHPSDEVSPDLR